MLDLTVRYADYPKMLIPLGPFLPSSMDTNLAGYRKSVVDVNAQIDHMVDRVAHWDWDYARRIASDIYRRKGLFDDNQWTVAVGGMAVWERFVSELSLARTAKAEFDAQYPNGPDWPTTAVWV